MDVNSLVTHKHLKSLGIGVVSQNLKNAIRVRFGENDLRKFKPEELRTIDISKCHVVSLSQFQHEIFRKANKNEYMIVGNHLKQFTELGWIYIREIKEEDLQKYKIVLDSRV